ncbi:MAG: hypothetical protein JWQ81_4588 [Amycolatopsis sp.]|uniref:hypothetical protein n=1 Tax=Amycolatopsis sp. TaxID=37632 RepID=UPI00260E80BC|nr:hypothetical protein [Amycolatopsis sp.]MCU1683849.1 hypothetical protein [Amycolatopsis sp.]
MRVWVDTVGVISWVAAYILGVYVVEQFGRSRWRHVVPFAALPVGFVAYVVIAWTLGRWGALGVGLALLGVGLAGLNVGLARRKQPGERCGRLQPAATPTSC